MNLSLTNDKPGMRLSATATVVSPSRLIISEPMTSATTSSSWRSFSSCWAELIKRPMTTTSSIGPFIEAGVEAGVGSTVSSAASSSVVSCACAWMPTTAVAQQQAGKGERCPGSLHGTALQQIAHNGLDSLRYSNHRAWARLSSKMP